MKQFFATHHSLMHLDGFLTRSGSLKIDSSSSRNLPLVSNDGREFLPAMSTYQCNSTTKQM